MAIGTTAALLGAAAIGGAASLAAGAIQGRAAEQASNVQAQASDRALALQERQYTEGMARTQPWVDAGRKALDAYQGELGLSDAAKAGTFKSGFRETPGYQFAVSEGEKGVTSNLAALGMKNSGAALKALTRFRQGLADQSYDKYLDRLSGVSTGGQTQVANDNAMGQSAVAQMTQSINDSAAARASGYVGGANAWSGALGNLSNMGGYALGLSSNNFGLGTPWAPTGNALRLGFQRGV